MSHDIKVFWLSGMIIQKSDDVTRHPKLTPRNSLSVFCVRRSKTCSVDAQSAENTHGLESDGQKPAIRWHTLFAECIKTVILVLGQLPIVHKLNYVDLDAWNGILTNLGSTALSTTDRQMAESNTIPCAV